MPRIKTTKSLVKALHKVAEDAPHSLSVRIGGSSYSVSGNGTYLGTVAGEVFAALIIGEDTTLILERDYHATAKTLKIIEPTVDQLETIAKDLLPEPEPPAEVKAANEALASLPRLPKGWRYALDGKGNLIVVEMSGGEEGESGSVERVERAPRAPRGTAQPKPKKPEVVKGMKLKRNKDGHLYRVTGVDKNLKKVFFEPLKKGEGDEGLAAGYPMPVFWKNWAEVAG